MYVRRMKLVDFVIYLFIAISSLGIVVPATAEDKNIFVYGSFLLIGGISFYGSINTANTINIARTVNIFSYVFFFLAPWQQYSTGANLWAGNGLSINFTDDLYLKANMIIIISLLFFNVTYFRLRKHDEIFNDCDNRMDISAHGNRKTLLLISIASFSALLISGNLTGNGIEIGNTSVNSQLWNMVRFTVVCGLVVYDTIYDNKREMAKDQSFKILMILFVLIFFPFWGNMARFLLLGAYVVVLALWLHTTKYKSWYFLMFYLGFVYLFSSMRLAESISVLQGMKMNFLHVDYDAYQMLMTVIQYTDDTGIVFGKNILSALSFIIPRSIWLGKLPNSGGLAASYYGSWFTNVSSPLFGELYFASGWLGVVIGSIALGDIARKIDGWRISRSIWKKGAFCTTVGMTVYICRGALLASMSFTLGLLLTVWIMSKIAKVKI